MRQQHLGPWPGAYRPMWVAAAWLHRPPATIRTWYRRGLIDRTCCDVATRAVLVHLDDVLALHQQAQTRRIPPVS